MAPDNGPLLAPGCLTIASLLRHHGYATGMIGKWHLGWEWAGPQPSRMNEVRNGNKDLQWDYTQPIRSGPTARGFDYYFGVDLPNMPPFTFIENETVIGPFLDTARARRRPAPVLSRYACCRRGREIMPRWRNRSLAPPVAQVSRTAWPVNLPKLWKRPDFPCQSAKISRRMTTTAISPAIHTAGLMPPPEGCAG